MSRYCWRLRKFQSLDLFLVLIQRDSTAIQMVNRDSDDDKEGRKRSDFNIDDDAFDSDVDEYDLMHDDEFEDFINPSQKKKPGTSKPKDLSRSAARVVFPLSVAPEPEPITAPKPVAPTLIPCVGCRQPFLRIIKKSQN